MDQDRERKSSHGDISTFGDAQHANEPKSGSGEPSRDRSTSPEDCAIGDSDEDDEEMVEIQRTMTQSRMLKQKSPEELRRKVIPFHWAPMLSPLTSADIDACAALDRAALPDRSQASNRELVRTNHSFLFAPLTHQLLLITA